jgi:hypothetical protein
MLTSQDIKIIKNIVLATEERLTNKIDNKMATLSEQILEYTNSVRDSHEDWLKDHEKRIGKLEEHKLYRP